MQLDAAELKAQRDLAAAQIDTAERDAEAQAAQLEFVRADSQRQQDLLKSRTVSPSEAERAASAAKAQARAVEAARTRVVQARAQLAQMDAQLGETGTRNAVLCEARVIADPKFDEAMNQENKNGTNMVFLSADCRSASMDSCVGT